MLYNATNKNLIIARVKYAKTAFEKLKGLMFKRKFDYALIFPFESAGIRKLAIHMLFVFCHIDVIYVREGKVVDKYQKVAPFTLYLAPKEPADTLIELPCGTLDVCNVYFGDLISVRDNC